MNSYCKQLNTEKRASNFFFHLLSGGRVPHVYCRVVAADHLRLVDQLRLLNRLLVMLVRHPLIFSWWRRVSQAPHSHRPVARSRHQPVFRFGHRYAPVGYLFITYLPFDLTDNLLFIKLLRLTYNIQKLLISKDLSNFYLKRIK